MRPTSENEAAQLHWGFQLPEPTNGLDIERDQIQLAEAQDEERCAQLSLDLCRARMAAARVQAIVDRLAAYSRS